MRVKRLEIQGFKSFKDKTVIHFDHSITGIVGPNGCGKSNIVDAFFWVMGEQSYKHMRGSNSEDLIFNGSHKYSALGMAEATLVLETPDVKEAFRDLLPEIPDNLRSYDSSSSTPTPEFHFKEISVTRRLYRSGEGEYLINGNSARLKDIQELFMDTGVGAKGYSVIEQGQIGKIVNAKPEDRRLLIEEAAGIAKYKARKKESLRKIEATEANLSRLTDILQEIEKNLGSLERQAQKARLYKQYKDELLTKEMTWGRRKYRILQARAATLRQEKETVENELLAFRAQLQSLENNVEVERTLLMSETKEAEDLQMEIQGLGEQLSQQKSALELSRRRQGDLKSQTETLTLEMEDLQLSLLKSQERLNELLNEAQEAETLYQCAADDAQRMNDVVKDCRQQATQTRSQLDQYQRQLRSESHQITELTSKAASLLSRAESARNQAERLAQQILVQNEKMTQVEEELQERQGSVVELREKKSGLQAELKERNQNLRDEEQLLHELEKKRHEALKNLAQVRSRLHSLEELDAAHEGLADGPKAALEWARNEKKADQLKAFTDLISIQKGFETVLEAWLEAHTESLFAHKQDWLFTLLHRVRDQKQGRVEVQLVPEIVDSTSGEGAALLPVGVQQALDRHGVKATAILENLVSISPQWPSCAGLLGKLVRKVLVVESAEDIQNFLEKEPVESLSGWSLVSLDGTVLEIQQGSEVPHISLRGGSFSGTGTASVLKRKKLIEELREETQQAELLHQELENSHHLSKEKLTLLRAQLQSCQMDLQSMDVNLAGLERDIHQLQRSFQQAEDQLDFMREEQREMGETAEQAENEHREIQVALQALMAQQHSLDAQANELTTLLHHQESVVAEKERDLQSLRVKEASDRERSVSLKREQQGVQSLLSDRQRRIDEIRRILERTSREHTEFTDNESELNESVEALTLKLGNARENLSEVKDRIEQSNALVKNKMDLIKKVHSDCDEANSESMRLALEAEKVSGETSHLVLNLEEKYGAGCLETPVAPSTQSDSDHQGEPSQADGSPHDLSPEEEAQLGDEVERLRERIRRLGEVNIMAIEEFDQLKQRYDHLLSEKADLEKSMANLREAIDYINKTSEERFKKAFHAIAARFEKLFPIIFGGGQANLSLVYPEGSTDILEAGVDILAQPPGKKIANITLLSGGEKALTAVSLIFAIFMVKPSPFCVLDEVDAPLDDANIGKFNALLKEMSSKSQFILITHNKKTMELNDTLYGVTMEEPGVSKMVSIEMH